jgi:hypothetical protein
MSFTDAIADTSPSRSQLRLMALAQWVRTGLALAWGAAPGRGYVGRAVMLWRVVQAVRLALQLARRLSEADDALAPAAPVCSDGPDAAPDSVPTWSLVASPAVAPANAAALSGALAELAGRISAVLGLTPARRPSVWAVSAASAPATLGALHPRDQGTPPCGQRPDRPPGPKRPDG